MRAVVYDRYGGPEVLRLDEVPRPAPRPDQVVVEVAATSINLTDWECLRGTPIYSRIGGLRSPANHILGSDIAGRLVEIGSSVTGFAVGDLVYADNLWLKGGFAEYAVVPADGLAVKPPELTAAQASTIPQAAAIAVQGVAGVGPGQRVLINGGGGGSGMFAVQLAKEAGAHVTAVDNEHKLDFMATTLGADEVIDYRRDDFTRSGRRWDLILDLVADRAARDYRRVLARGGRYRCVGGSVSTLLRVQTAGWLVARLSGRRMGILGVKDGPEAFVPLAERCAAGEIDIHIDRTFGLDEVPEALAHVGEGRARGKVVVEIR